MDITLRNAIKFVLVSAIVIVLAGVIFVAGFGSAYLLTGSGALPTWGRATPTATPPPSASPTPVPIPTPVSEDEETFQLFWDVWGLVRDNFYGELPDMQQVTYAAIRGMLNTLDDPYTAFLDPQAAAIVAEDASGEFEGIGAWVNMGEDGVLEITEPFKGSQAEQAGILPGDRVLAVNGVSIVGVSLYEAIGMIRGPAGTQVTLLIEREGVAEPLEITVIRARYDVPTIEVEMLDDSVGYIRLYEFNSIAADQMKSGLEELLDQGAKGIVFDLRGNPGGWLDQAVDVADLFLDDGVILIERWSDGGEQKFSAHPGDIGEDIPLVVLVNGGTASGAEIVAGALQDHERAVMVGELTFGKGSVQRSFTLSDESELRVTISRWFTPNNRAIHGEGLTPDIEVPSPEGEDVDLGVDPQLERAVEYLLTGE